MIADVLQCYCTSAVLMVADVLQCYCTSAVLISIIEYIVDEKGLAGRHVVTEYYFISRGKSQLEPNSTHHATLLL